MGPLTLWPALSPGGPLEYLQVCLHVVLWAELGEPTGRAGGRGVADGVLGEPEHRLTEQSKTECLVSR